MTGKTNNILVHRGAFNEEVTEVTKGCHEEEANKASHPIPKGNPSHENAHFSLL